MEYTNPQLPTVSYMLHVSFWCHDKDIDLVTCWERADLLALVSNVYYIFVAFPYGILGQV